VKVVTLVNAKPRFDLKLEAELIIYELMRVEGTCTGGGVSNFLAFALWLFQHKRNASSGEWRPEYFLYCLLQILCSDQARKSEISI
jgi:hypothetical protein